MLRSGRPISFSRWAVDTRFMLLIRLTPTPSAITEDQMHRNSSPAIVPCYFLISLNTSPTRCKEPVTKTWKSSKRKINYLIMYDMVNKTSLN